MIWGAARRRARVYAAVATYTQWRSERDAVRALAETGLAHQLARTQALPGAW
jgi:hypothetical protein